MSLFDANLTRWMENWKAACSDWQYVGRYRRALEVVRLDVPEMLSQLMTDSRDLDAMAERIRELETKLQDTAAS